MKRRLLLTPILILTILLQGCGGSSFASQLRGILAASGPLIASLSLGDKRQAVISDFTDLASGAATLADDLKACGDAKPCKLDAVAKYETRFWDVLRRGHFNLSPKLERIQDIISGIIASAKIFYGSRQTVTRGGSPRVVTEAELKAQVNELKAAMQP